MRLQLSLSFPHEQMFYLIRVIKREQSCSKMNSRGWHPVKKVTSNLLQGELG